MGGKLIPKTKKCNIKVSKADQIDLKTSADSTMEWNDGDVLIIKPTTMNRTSLSPAAWLCVFDSQFK